MGLRLGRAFGACIGWLVDILHELGVPEPELRANDLYLQAIGVLHLARSGVALRTIMPGLTETFPVTAEQVRAACDYLPSPRPGRTDLVDAHVDRKHGRVSRCRPRPELPSSDPPSALLASVPYLYRCYTTGPVPLYYLKVLA